MATEVCSLQSAFVQVAGHHLNAFNYIVRSYLDCNSNVLLLLHNDHTNATHTCHRERNVFMLKHV